MLFGLFVNRFVMIVTLVMLGLMYHRRLDFVAESNGRK